MPLNSKVLLGIRLLGQGLTARYRAQASQLFGLADGGKMSRIRTGVLGGLFVVGFYTPGASPVFAFSASYRDNYARDYADRVSWNSSRGGALGGATRGAAGGALFGASGGNAGLGAAIGAGVGAIAGGARRQNNWSSNYNRAYSDCRRGFR